MWKYPVSNFSLVCPTVYEKSWEIKNIRMWTSRFSFPFVSPKEFIIISMKFYSGDLHRLLLWSLELLLNRTNLKPMSHMDIMGFFIISHKLFDISRRNLIPDTFTDCSNCCIEFIIRELIESLVHMKKFRNV
jgi:hypothetical protein